MINPLSGMRLAKNTIWNFLGLFFPLLIGIFSIPLLIDGMGKERFGLLTIVWMGVGYFSLFDMGLARALTKLVAEKLGNKNEKDFGSLIWSALWLILIFGFIASSIVGLSSELVVKDLFSVPKALIKEAYYAFIILSIGLPFVIVTSALVGILEAHQKFGLITLIRIPLGALTFLGPLATLHYSPSLVWATLAMLIGRVLAAIIFYFAATRSRRELLKPELPNWVYVKPLFKFGGWLTVTNAVGPIMVYFDRFLIGAMLTLTAVTYYVTPYEVLSRLQLITVAIMGVMFPAFTRLLVDDHKKLASFYEKTTTTLMVIMLPLTSFIFLFASEGLEIWLGKDFSEQSTVVAKCLVLGWMINVLAQGPFTILQSFGRPDVVAKAHIAELIPYLFVLWLLTSHYGIAGTAFAWLLRICVDTIILNALTWRMLPSLRTVVRRTYIELAIIICGAGMIWFISDIYIRVGLFCTIVLIISPKVFSIIKHFINPQEKIIPE